MSTLRDHLRLRMLRAVALAWIARLPQAPLHPLPERPRLLLIRPDHLGDLLFATPALRYLRTRLPDAHLTALVGPWGEAVWRDNRHLDQVRTLPFPGFTRKPKGPLWEPYALLLRAARNLRSGRYDAALVLRADHWWGAWLARLAGIPRVIGYEVPPTRPFLTAPVPYTAGRHEVLQNLALVQALTGEEDGSPAPKDAPLEFTPPPHAAERARALLSDELPPICIHPGAGVPVKTWPPERWAEVADALAEEIGAPIVLTGSAGELDLAWKVAARMAREARVLAGKMDLGELAALFARARLVLGSDSGPLKLAQAVGARTVHLYGPVDVRTFGPWGDPAAYRVVQSPFPCVPCNRLDYRPGELAEHPCMAAISGEAVLEAARALLRRESHPRMGNE
ncbi:MAG: glycosyltransferase family 9 protein [Anaerolineae bacterium]